MAQWWKNLGGDEDQSPEDLFATHARAGDGKFAIAYALLQVARALTDAGKEPGNATPARPDDRLTETR